MPVVKPDGTVVLALVRGDDRLERGEAATTRSAGTFRPATDEEIRTAFGADGGSLGPIGFAGEVVADETLREGQFVAGANRDGWHLRGVEAGRDYEPRFADLREPREGDRCPECGGALAFQTAIEVGHIFKLGTLLLEAARARRSSTRTGRRSRCSCGSYGIGPGRIMAAIVEQHHDEHGIVWPRGRALRRPHRRACRALEEQAEALERGSRKPAPTCCSTTASSGRARSSRTRICIGCPMRVTVGKKTLEDGAVDVLVRRTGDDQRVRLGQR